MGKMEFTTVEYPWLRFQLIDYIGGLADREYQCQAWIEDKCPGGGHDELDYTIHFFFDDTRLASVPEATIGLILKNEKEAAAIADLTRKIDFVLEKYGTHLTDKEYIEKEEWEDVIQSAKVAKELFGPAEPV
jgi:hypothetical protein